MSKFKVVVPTIILALILSACGDKSEVSVNADTGTNTNNESSQNNDTPKPKSTLLSAESSKLDIAKAMNGTWIACTNIPAGPQGQSRGEKWVFAFDEGSDVINISEATTYFYEQPDCQGQNMEKSALSASDSATMTIMEYEGGVVEQGTGNLEGIGDNYVIVNATLAVPTGGKTMTKNIISADGKKWSFMSKSSASNDLTVFVKQ